jgi:hypothetical protein
VRIEYLAQIRLRWLSMHVNVSAMLFTFRPAIELGKLFSFSFDAPGVERSERLER